MKKMVFVVAIVMAFTLLFAGLASAQNAPRPTVTLSQQNLPRGNGVGTFSANVGQAAAQPAGCPNGDCLVYGGDSDPNDPNADGLWDNNSSYFGIDGQVYSPFVWTKVGKCGGKCAWNVDNIFANIEMYPYPPLIDSVKWAIVQGVAAGGTPTSVTTICSGNDSAATIVDTGRLFFGIYEEYAVSANVAGCSFKGKKATTFWQIVQPQTSQYQLAYESNVGSAAANAIGTPEPVDQSYFYSPGFGFPTFTNTTQLGPFHTFSAGVCGTLGK